MIWNPSLGAVAQGPGVRFRVWAPKAKSVDLMAEPVDGEPFCVGKMTPGEEGFFSGIFPDLKHGDRYKYRLDGQTSYPDPASRFQPDGVHGPSMVVDPSQYPWKDSHWHGLSMEELVLYELHVGTFTPEGTFAGAEKKLEILKGLGVTAIELMPVGDFPGERNWGYDGVDLFAPARCYGQPDEFRALVDTAHQLGLGVFLDVVYNHLGPEGAWLGAFSDYYFSPKHKSPWGDAVNLDDVHCGPVREFFIENALHWVHEYHIDGLRLDATHAMVDDSPTHFLQELAEKVRASLDDQRSVLLIAEDDRNENRLVLPVSAGGFGLDAVWADDFHHQVRVLLAGDKDGYYRDYTGTPEDLAKTIRQGWFYTGQPSRYWKKNRGTSPGGIPLKRFVHCIQNHDQVGNRALGDRLNFSIDLASYRAASGLLLFCPSTPLLFMGQEWAAGTPFCYFTDHPEPLGKLVTEGRRNEFRQFESFHSPESVEKIPDPQALKTFLDSKLNWRECETGEHKRMLNLYHELIYFRKKELGRLRKEEKSFEVAVLKNHVLALKRQSEDKDAFLCVVCLKGKSKVFFGDHPATTPPEGQEWEMLWDTERPDFAMDPHPPRYSTIQGHGAVDFQGPCAVFFKSKQAI